MNDEFTKFLEIIDYNDPRTLDLKLIDFKIRNAVEKINKSNWCWTLWSCQGHPKKNGGMSNPYFVFIVRSSRLNNLLEYLMNTLDKDCSLRFPVHNSYSMDLSWGYSNEFFSIISVHWCFKYVKQSGMLKKLHTNINEMSEKILEYNYE